MIDDRYTAAAHESIARWRKRDRIDGRRYGRRAAARAAGLDYYMTGVPCRRGHVAQRYVSSGHCVDCARGARATRALDPHSFSCN